MPKLESFFEISCELANQLAQNAYTIRVETILNFEIFFSGNGDFQYILRNCTANKHKNTQIMYLSIS